MVNDVGLIYKEKFKSFIVVRSDSERGLQALDVMGDFGATQFGYRFPDWTTAVCVCNLLQRLGIVGCNILGVLV